MTLSPLDDYPVHQAAQVIRHPATSDRNFYDRYYFNCHPRSDQLMLIIRAHRPDRLSSRRQGKPPPEDGW